MHSFHIKSFKMSTTEVADCNVTIGGTTAVPEEIITTSQTLMEKYLLMFLYVIFAIGMIGNMFSFILFSRKIFIAYANSILFKALAVSDTMALAVVCVKTFLELQFNIYVLNISKWSCRFWNYVFFSSSVLSAWIITIIAVDRCYAVLAPLKYKVVFTKRRMHYILIVVIFLCAATSSFNLYGLDISKQFVVDINDYIIMCTTSERYILSYTIYLWADFLYYSVIPSIIIVVCNICIIYKVCLSNQRWQHGEGHSSRLAGMTVSLILISISHLLLTSPGCILLILYQIDIISVSEYKAMSNICLVLMQINNACNFFLYCISGSKFRQEIKVIFNQKI